jgi:hypothetical protein
MHWGKLWTKNRFRLDGHALRGIACILLFSAMMLAPGRGRTEPIEVVDVTGQKHRPLETTNANAIVLIFVMPDCPVANAYAPEINRIVAEYSAKRVSFYLVHVDRDTTAERARQHASDYGFRCPVLLDDKHALVEFAEATATPEAAVFSPEQRRLYLGRIDDRQAALGQRRLKPTRQDLRDALDAIIAHKPVRQSITKAVGCYIPKQNP